MANDFELVNQGIIDLLGADTVNKLENEKDVAIYHYGTPEIGPQQVDVNTPSIAVQMTNGRFQDSYVGDGMMNIMYEISIYIQGPNSESANKKLQDYADRVRKSIDTDHTLKGTAHNSMLESFNLSLLMNGEQSLAYVFTWQLNVTVTIRLV